MTYVTKTNFKNYWEKEHIASFCWVDFYSVESSGLHCDRYVVNSCSWLQFSKLCLLISSGTSFNVFKPKMWNLDMNIVLGWQSWVVIVSAKLASSIIRLDSHIYSKSIDIRSKCRWFSRFIILVLSSASRALASFHSFRTFNVRVFIVHLRCTNNIGRSTSSRLAAVSDFQRVL